MTGSVLIVYEEVPEQTTFYLVPDGQLLPEVEEALLQANGEYVNGSSEEFEKSLTIVQVALANAREDMEWVVRDEEMELDLFNRIVCSLGRFKVFNPVELTSDQAIAKVYHTGFIC